MQAVLAVVFFLVALQLQDCQLEPQHLMGCLGYQVEAQGLIPSWRLGGRGLDPLLDPVTYPKGVYSALNSGQHC